MVFKLDKKYDDPRNSHKIENGCHDLAKATSGRSVFRRTEGEMAQFIAMMWNRIHSQYYLQATFPCYRPAPYMEHTSVLKVEGLDAEGIKFEAASFPAPKPEITAVYPPQAYRTHVDDGNFEMTIDGKGFCGGPGEVKAYVGGGQVTIKSQMPYRLTVTTNESVDTGVVKVGNRFGEVGESAAKFEVVKPPKGAEASSALMYMIIGGVVIVVLAVVIVALKSRKAKVPAGAPPAAPIAPSAASVQAPPAVAAPRTVALGSIAPAWVLRIDGNKVPLVPGPNLIGREAHCRIKLEVPGVSREHAKIEVDPGGGVFVEDLGSTNGTFWGLADATLEQVTKLVERRQFKSGEAVWIGGEKLTIVIDGGGAAQEG
jgi:hypothetical protein